MTIMLIKLGDTFSKIKKLDRNSSSFILDERNFYNAEDLAKYLLYKDGKEWKYIIDYIAKANKIWGWLDDYGIYDNVEDKEDSRILYVRK